MKKIHIDKKIVNIVIVAFLLLIPLILSMYFRAIPYYMPSADTIAARNLNEYITTGITNDVNQKFAYLPDNKRQEIINAQLETFYNNKTMMADFATQQKLYADQIRNAFRNKEGETYLNDIDTWFQYYWTRNYVNNGYIGDIEKDGVPYTTHRQGRFEIPLEQRFHPWLLAKWSYIYHMFDPNSSLMKSTWFFTVFFTTLSVIPAFFIGRRLGGNLAGLVAGILIGIHTAILSRTIGGFADTDPHNVLWPLLIIWFFIEAFETEKKWAKITFSSLAGLCLGFYFLAWGGWWHVFDLLIGAIIIYLGYLLIKHSGPDKAKILIYSFLFVLTVAVFAFVISIKSIGFSLSGILAFLNLGILILSFGMVVYLLFIKNLNHVIHGFKKSDEFKRSLYDLVPFIIVGILSVIILGTLFYSQPVSNSAAALLNTLSAPFSFTELKSVAVGTIWPNVLTTVAELNLAPMGNIIQAIGGTVLLFIAFLGIALLLINKKSSKKEWVFVGITCAYYLLLILLLPTIFDAVVQDALYFGILVMLPWVAAFVLGALKDYEFDIFSTFMLAAYLVITAYASTRGIRFTALMAIPFVILVAVAVGRIFTYGTSWISKTANINKLLVSITLAIILLGIVLFGQISNAIALSNSELSSMNDAWYDSLIKIKESSQSGKAITTSWWDFGHWFVAITERSVTFDGASQGKRIHWVGKTLATAHEKESVDILRMLNCGQEYSYDKLYSITKDEKKSVDILYKVMKENKTEAMGTYLNYGLTNDEANYVLNLTHCEPWQQFFIVSDDMIGKAGVWAHFGLWNFTKASMYNEVKKKSFDEGKKTLMDKFGLDESTAVQYFDEIQTTDADEWVNSWPRYVSSASQCTFSGNIYNCANGFSFNVTSEKGFGQSQGVSIIPVSYVFIDKNGKFKSIRNSNPNVQVSVIFSNTGSRPRSIISEPQLAESMFTRLFFFDGLGLTRFKQISHMNGIDGSEIYVYEVNLTNEK